MMKHAGLYIFFFIIAAAASAQPLHYTTTNAHSHNDYEQALPFYNAYARHFGSIEADVWAVDGKLMVAHEKDHIQPDRTFKNLYLKPLLKRLKANNGKAYQDREQLQLLIDFKSSYAQALPLLKELLTPYSAYFDCRHNPDAVRIVISGEMPPPDSLHYFDSIFTFDGRIGKDYADKDLEKVVLVSANIQQFVRAKSTRELSKTEYERLKKIVDSVHSRHKLIRFWGTPSNIPTYRLLMKLGVDYIGTDKLQLLECLLDKKKTLPLRLNREKNP